jgi:glucose/arabinose dehydrogenase
MIGGDVMNRPLASRVTRSFALLALLLAFGVSTRSQAQTFDDPGFAAQTIATVAPFEADGIRFAPDGRMFIVQKNGIVRVFKNGSLLPTPFIDLSAQVNTADDRGLIGFTLDPGFAENGYVYLGFVYESQGDSNSSDPRTSRLIRVTADPADPDVALPSSQLIILDGIPATGTSHTLDTLRFAPDGTLFMSNGDGTTQPTTADPLALEVQDVNTYRGKILRINSDGTAPSPPQLLNPFYDGTDSIRSKVWAYGLRNPYRFDFHPVLGDLYTNDTGWNTWEELDHIIPGRNYGWPCFEGPLPQPAYQSTFPGVCSLLPQSATVAPLVTYDRTVGSAALGGCFYTGGIYPVQYLNNFFWSDYTGNFIRRLVLDSAGNLVSNIRFATNVGTPTAMEVGPDGLLYMADFVSGNIKRIVFNGPVANAGATPTSGYSPLVVQFSGSTSTDGLGRALSYQWNFGDGQTSNLPDPQHSYVSSIVQTFNAQLTVTNTASQSASEVVPVTVGSLPPVPVITAPAANDPGVEPGDTITYQGFATDPDEGTLPPSALSWTILLHHNTHVHRSAGATGTSGSVIAQEHGIGTYAYEIILTATDSSGLKTSTSVIVPILPDTIPPSAPTNLTATALGASGASLAWTAATDNGAVDNYPVERCAGVGCSSFAQVGTSPETTFVDVGLNPSTSYTYRVRAADTNGNLGPYSNTATITTGSVTQNPPGLVAAYSFDAGSGATLEDSSGLGNNGGINGATWTAGHDGNGLAFDGVSNVVLVNDSTSLRLTTGMTLEAWILPTQVLTNWKAILQKETDSYFLNGNTATNHVGGGGTFNGQCCGVVESIAAIPVNQWSHIATTYDGANLKMFVNGVQVATLAQTGSLLANSSPLRIGGDTYPNEFFAGVIDNLRIYNRALSLAEIQADMATPVGGTAPPDTTPPVRSAGAPTGALPAGTTQATLSLTTDEPATCRYGTTPNVSYASEPIAFTTTGGTAHSTVVTGLANGQSYTYYVRCQDGAGNPNTNDLAIAFSVASATDTTPPTVSLTAPAAGTVTGLISITASASDAGGVAGVQFLLDGTPLGSEVTVAPYTLSWNSAAVANGPHTLAARARDTSGNLATSATVTVTVSNTTSPPPTGLVAAYSFDAGSGTVLADQSGNGNNGTINGATWAAGHDGQALSFNGTSNVVVVNDSASLDLTTGMTFEAWVRPSQTLSNWKAILQKQTDSYFLNANTAGNHVGSGGTFNGNCCGVVEGTSGLPVNQWSHLASTYDGTTLRIYLNGTQVGSIAQTGSLEVNANPLRIGGDTYPNEFFPGLIDNLRIYNRALSAAEIQTDMVTPVGGSAPPDTTPPVLSAGAPTGSLPAGTTQTSISLTTNEAATCRYGTVAGTAFASLPNAFTSTGGTAHSTIVGGLANGQSYTFYVRCQDTAGNADTTDFPISFSVASDTTPPVRSAGAPTGVLAVGTTQTTLSLTTNESATCRYGTVAGTAYASLPNVFSTTGGTTHSTLVSGLANAQSYTFYVRCRDAANNANPDDFAISFSVAADTTPPVRSAGSPSGGLPAGTTQTTLSLTTNEAATCRYGTVAGTAYASLPNVFSTTGGTAHSTLVSGLANGQSYSFFVRCQDTAGNADTTDFSISFSVASPGDTTPPVRSAGSPSGALAAGTTQATLALTTDEAATCRYGTVAGTAYASLPNVFSTTGGTAHSTLVSGLANGQSYTFFVRCQDTAGNADTTDFSIAFSVANDTTPPTVSLTAPAAGTVSGVLSVTATASDAGGVAGVQFLLDGAVLGAEDTVAPYSLSWNSASVANGAHSVAARARDTAGNLATSTGVAITVNNVAAPPVGLVAAYSFNAGSGTVLADSSGNGNNGTITGATWVTGHDGQALSFNGTSNVVVVNDTASLHLTTAMTLEAWVRPTQTLSNWKAVLQKQVDAYFLNANTAGNHVGSGGTFNGVCCTGVEGTVALAPNQWTHLASTYDGTTLRLYVNGVLNSSLPRTGSLEVNGSPLRIGGDTYPGENFPGLIDNLRIYNRALSATEIQQDMITPVSP